MIFENFTKKLRTFEYFLLKCTILNEVQHSICQLLIYITLDHNHLFLTNSSLNITIYCDIITFSDRHSYKKS